MIEEDSTLAAVAENLLLRTHPLPIDVAIESLWKKGAFVERPDPMRVRRAVYRAMIDAEKELADRREASQIKSKIPTVAAALEAKAASAKEAVDDILAAMLSEDWPAQRMSLSYIKDTGLNLDVWNAFWEDIQSNLRSALDTLKDVEAVFYNARQNVSPKRGRTPAFLRLFISNLAYEWHAITGKSPRRVVDSASGEAKEAGDFHTFCLAAARSIQERHRIGSVDTAVRTVCKAWDRPLSW